MTRIAPFVAIAALLLAAPALAHDLDQNEALRLSQEGVIRPLEQLLQAALARYPDARLLEAELEEEDGRYIYEFEILTRDGAVRELELDARDGRLLKDKEDD